MSLIAVNFQVKKNDKRHHKTFQSRKKKKSPSNTLKIRQTFIWETEKENERETWNDETGNP